MIGWLSGHKSQFSSCTILVKQCSNHPGAKAVCFAGYKNFEGTLTQPRSDAFEMWQQSGEYFALNSMLSSLVRVLPSNLEEKTKKIKKMFSS